MQTTLQRNIWRTLIAALAFMAVVLLLFLNKITTPRYLSDIELRIHGLELLQQPLTLEAQTSNQWRLVSMNPQQQTKLNNALAKMPKRIQNKIETLSLDKLAEKYRETIATIEGKETVKIIKPNGVLFAVLHAPIETNRIVLTLSSVITHR